MASFSVECRRPEAEASRRSLHTRAPACRSADPAAFPFPFPPFRLDWAGAFGGEIEAAGGEIEHAQSTAATATP